MAWRNQATVLERLARIPARVKAALQTQLNVETNDLVDAFKRAAPVGTAEETHPGQLRDSIHAYRGNRELKNVVLANPKDENGHIYSGHVEYGHRAKDGTHVPASPFWWPTYRARKKAMRRRLSAAARKAIKVEFPG